jgi:hypothetical protein
LFKRFDDQRALSRVRREALRRNRNRGLVIKSSTFEKGTLSRGRVMIAVGILAAVSVVIVVLIVVSDALFGPR